MEIISYKQGCLGTMDFVFRIGKMKKAEEFCTYPIQKNDSTDKVYFQSSHRWAELNTKTGAIIMSARRAQYANKIWLGMCIVNDTAEYDKATPEQLDTILSEIRKTASPNCGGNNILSMFCDNSNADKI